jgi:hypothetical protein
MGRRALYRGSSLGAVVTRSIAYSLFKFKLKSQSYPARITSFTYWKFANPSSQEVPAGRAALRRLSRRRTP